MSHYRDHLDAARARIETLEAKLHERDASLAARDAELAEIRGEVARLRGDGGARGERGERGDDDPFDGARSRSGHRALSAALVLCGLVTGISAAVRPLHCHGRGGAPTVTLESRSGARARLTPAPAPDLALDPGATLRAELAAPTAARPASHDRLDAAVSDAFNDAKRRADICRSLDSAVPRGAARLTVTFAPDGAAEAEVGPPYAGTAVGACVEQIFREARVPSFDGEPRSLTKAFSL